MAKPKQNSKNKPDKKFLETLPGILTAIAGLLTAVAAIGGVILSPQAIPIIFPPTITPSPLPSLTATPNPTVTSSPIPPSSTPTKIVPRMWGFEACPIQCNEQNSTNSFAAGITKIYIQFNYENIPPKAPYDRIWTMNGKEWIHYACVWDGPLSGTENIKLSEPDGLNSGIWEMTIKVNGDILLQQQIVVVGNYKFWTPPGTVRACRLAN